MKRLMGEGGSQKRAERVARAIEDRIIELGWPVGHLIGSEPSLMAEYDASRGVLREAVRLLEHHGTARMRRGPGGGLVVEEPSAHAVRRSASLLLQYQRTDLASLVDARRALELTCFDIVAERFHDPHLSGRLLAAVQVDKALEHAADLGFHCTLIRLTGNKALGLFAQTLIEMHGEAISPLGAPQDPEFVLLDPSTCRKEHSAIYDALARGERLVARGRLEQHLGEIAQASLAPGRSGQMMA
ncbi:MAG: GntR family transcriptional regulator [Propionibacteriaceae bacterium]|nr:GntR family transcriptional regulator [Propionibacteriaceae bacterium]